MGEHVLDIFPPGELLKEELEARGWTQADLALILDRPPRLVNEIINAKRAITPETAHGLGLALGTSAQLWMNLETAYQLSRLRVDSDAVTTRARIYGRFPVRELQKRGWIPTVSDIRALEKHLLLFFGLPDIEADFNIAHAAKRTAYDKLSALQAAWLSRARQLAARTSAPPYDKNSLHALREDLRAHVERVEDLRQVPQVFNNYGIRLVIIEPLPGSKIDAACFWLGGRSPVIALSLRYDRHDILWHAIFHELDHLAHEEGRETAMIDSELCSSGATQNADPNEARANHNAAETLIPEKNLQEFVASARDVFSEVSIRRFAHSVHVHPGIVVGQLQHHEILQWSSFNHLKAKTRDWITPSAVTDGFGHFVK